MTLEGGITQLNKDTPPVIPFSENLRQGPDDNPGRYSLFHIHHSFSHSDQIHHSMTFLPI